MKHNGPPRCEPRTVKRIAKWVQGAKKAQRRRKLARIAR